MHLNSITSNAVASGRTLLIALFACSIATGTIGATETAFWSLDEGTGTLATDLSGTGNHGSLKGSAGWTQGVFGNAVDIQAHGALINVPHSSSLAVPGQLTVGAWVRPDSVRTQHVVNKAHFGKSDGWELSLSASGTVFVRFNQESAGNAFKFASNQAYASDGVSWTHLAFKYDGSTRRFYVDGNESASDYTPGLVIRTNTRPLSLGAQENGDAPLEGDLDDVQIYNVAAGEADIQSIMDGATVVSDLEGEYYSPIAPPLGGECGETPVNFKIAFMGDQGAGSTSVKVLELIKDEGAQAVVHAGDFDYDDDPKGWDENISSVLGAGFPYFANAGNHDDQVYYGSSGYQAHLERRMNILGIPWSGDYGVMSNHEYMGIQFVFTAPGVNGKGDGLHDNYIRSQLESSGAIWRISSWHKVMNKMQIGEKSDESGWGVYKESRRGGAIIATAHEHSYSRTHLMESFEDTDIASTSNTLVLRADHPGTGADEGRSFAFVSGLGGKNIRPERRDGAWIASKYSSTQHARSGALFGVFNYQGNPRKAYFYFKDIGGSIPDDFYVESTVGVDFTCE